MAAYTPRYAIGLVYGPSIGMELRKKIRREIHHQDPPQEGQNTHKKSTHLAGINQKTSHFIKLGGIYSRSREEGII